MAVLLLTYDLNKEGKSKVDYDEFYKVRNSYAYARLSESSYALSTTDSPADVYNKLKPHMDENDHVYVINLKRPYTGFGPKQVNDWLEKYLPY